MLTAVVPLLVVLAAPSPAPAPVAPAPSPLREIGRVEAISVCSAIVVHANSAIGAALDNDHDLALVINRLRTTDLDDENPIKRRNGMNDLSTLAGRIRMAALGAAAEIKRLRVIASQTTDPTRKAELTAFADALSGAIARQRKAGVDLDAMLTIIDGRRAVEDVDTPQMIGDRDAVAADPGRSAISSADSGTLRNPAAPVTPSRVNDVLRGVADDLAARTQQILSDEGVAADHSVGATTGC
jgi:hypothetical protein